MRSEGYCSRSAYVCVCLLKSHLTYEVYVCLENAVTYSAGKEGQKIVGICLKRLRSRVMPRNMSEKANMLIIATYPPSAFSAWHTAKHQKHQTERFCMWRELCLFRGKQNQVGLLQNPRPLLGLVLLLRLALALALWWMARSQDHELLKLMCCLWPRYCGRQGPGALLWRKLSRMVPQILRWSIADSLWNIELLLAAFQLYWLFSTTMQCWNGGTQRIYLQSQGGGSWTYECPWGDEKGTSKYKSCWGQSLDFWWDLEDYPEGEGERKGEGEWRGWTWWGR